MDMSDQSEAWREPGICALRQQGGTAHAADLKVNGANAQDACLTMLEILQKLQECN